MRVDMQGGSGGSIIYIIPVSPVQTYAKGNLDFYTFGNIKMYTRIQYPIIYHNEWTVSVNFFYFLPP